MLSWPPATTILAAPSWICWAPSATARKPEPQSWFMPQAGASTGMPARIEACRAGFCPAPAARIWPKMTSETSPGSRRARSRAPRIATLPNSWAGRLASAPLKAPTGVRAALAMTIVDWSVLIVCSKARGGCRGGMDCAGRPCAAQSGHSAGLRLTIAGLNSQLQLWAPAVQPANPGTTGLVCAAPPW